MTKTIADLTTELQNLINSKLEAKVWATLSQVEKDSIARFVVVSNELVKDIKERVREDLLSGGKIRGARLSSDTISYTCADYPALRDSLVKSLGYTAEDIDARATITMSEVDKLCIAKFKAHENVEIANLDDAGMKVKVRNDYGTHFNKTFKSGALNIK